MNVWKKKPLDVPVACGFCGLGVRDGRTAKVTLPISRRDLDERMAYTGHIRPSGWPTRDVPICTACFIENEAGDPIKTACRILGVEHDRFVNAIVKGVEGHRFGDTESKPPLVFNLFAHERGITKPSGHRWAHVADELRTAYAALLRESRVTVRVLESGCSYCRRTHLPVAEGSFAQVSYGGRADWYCPKCAAATAEAFNAGQYEGFDIALSDAAGVPTWHGIGVHYGVMRGQFRLGKDPWEAVDLHGIYSDWQRQQAHIAKTGPKMVRS